MKWTKQKENKNTIDNQLFIKSLPQKSTLSPTLNAHLMDFLAVTQLFISFFTFFTNFKEFWSKISFNLLGISIDSILNVYKMSINITGFTISHLPLNLGHLKLIQLLINWIILGCLSILFWNKKILSF